jgi:PTH1 family peptidyl-tRNA hydrolase
MFCVVGLGNPGAQYDRTRHNVGFELTDELARRAGVDIRREECFSLTAETEIRRTKVLLVKPQTFMNRSGLAVAEICRRYEIDGERVVVGYDDLDLPLGRLRVRGPGSAGGHRGVASILESLAEPRFARIRLGIGRPPAGTPTVDYVLGRFSEAETDLATDLIGRGADAIEDLVDHGLLHAMNRFNHSAAGPSA